MDVATAFYSGALRTSHEVIQLMCQMLDDETVETVGGAASSPSADSSPESSSGRIARIAFSIFLS